MGSNHVPSSGVVLVVDDEAANRKLVGLALARNGYRTLQAEGGREALALLDRERVDAIVLDLMMPEMDGMEILGLLKRHPRWHRIPVVVVTAAVDHQRRMRALEAGAEELLGKPIDQLELSARVRNLVRLKRSSDLLEDEVRSMSLEAHARERDYRALVETMPGIVRVVGLDGRIEYINRCPDGGDPEAHLDTSFPATLGAWGEDLWDTVRGSVEREETVTFETTVVTDDDDEGRSVEHHARLMGDRSGRERILVVSVDRTEQWQAARALEEREYRLARQNHALTVTTGRAPATERELDEELENLVTSAADVLNVRSVGLWLVEEEEEGPLRLKAASPDAPAGRLRGLADGESGDDWLLQMGQAAPTEVASTEEEEPQVTPYLLAPLRQGAELIGVLVALSDEGQPRRWPLDEHSFLVGMARRMVLLMNALERELASEELRSATRSLERIVEDRSASLAARARTAATAVARVSAIFDAVADALLAIDPQGRVIEANEAAAQLLGEGRGGAEIVGRDLNELLGNAELLQAVTGLIQSGNGTLERRVDVRGRMVDARASTARTEGELLGVVVVLHDVTELLALDRLKDELVATVNHELRTPLTSLRGFTELLYERELERDEQRRFLKIILGETDRLTELINDFLELSKMESGGMDYLMERVEDIGPLLVESVEALQPRDPSKYELVVDVEEPVPPVELDRARIRQVLANLLSNAVKFSPDGGRIVVRAFAEGDELVVSVSDQGIGIPDNAMPRLFSKFYRVDNRATRKIGGTGLGLALIKEIVESHGGTVEVRSVLDEGSTFRLRLPRLTD